MDVLQLSTTQTVLLYVVSIAISLFFVLATALAVAGLVLVSKVKKVIVKAEDVIDSVEDVTDTIKNIGAQASGPMAAFKIIKAIVDVVNRKK